MNINLTLIGQLIAFAGFVLFCMRYVWPPITAAMAERAQKINDGLAAADRASHDLEIAKKQAVAHMIEAKRDAAGIVESANKRAAQLIDEAKTAANAEAERIKVAAVAEIEQERARAQEHLMTQVSALAIAGAEKILGAEIDAAKHAELLTSLTAEQ